MNRENMIMPFSMEELDDIGMISSFRKERL